MSVWIEQAASILFSFESKLAGFLRKKEALKKVVSAKHPELYDKNLNAINIGYNL